VKPVKFLGNALDALKRFPEFARKKAGYELELVQLGIEPDDWKPMTSVGAGVREVRVRDEQGIFRVMYVAKFAHFVYVLHCFQKKTQKTSDADIELVRRRYRELEKELLR
jgi:phage-related protein